MIVECRPSSYRKCVVKWQGLRVIQGVRRCRKELVIKEVEFVTFADANGFARGMEKRGIKGLMISFKD